MAVTDINKTTETGKVRDFEIPFDDNGVPIGYTVDEVFARVDKILSEGYGVDFAKVHRMIESGELNGADLSDELLSRPEFAYKPYPEFKAKPLPENFKPKPCLLDALETSLDDDDELNDFPHFPEEYLNRMRAEILADGPDDEIPCDGNGDPIGYTWEETRAMMYRILH